MERFLRSLPVSDPFRTSAPEMSFFADAPTSATASAPPTASPQAMSASTVAGDGRFGRNDGTGNLLVGDAATTATPSGRSGAPRADPTQGDGGPAGAGYSTVTVFARFRGWST